MQCYTNQPLRKLAGLLSPSTMRWTEMEKVDDLFPNIEMALDKRLGREKDDDNLILQLGSNNVHKVGACARVATRKFPNLRGINLNCGCPAIDVGGAPTYGATLMKDPSLTARLVESMSNAVVATYGNDVEISAKCRIGVFDDERDLRALNQEDYEYLTRYVSIIRDAGAAHVILHARPAILSLSPIKNRIMPNLEYDIVNRIASDFRGDVKVTLNGGIGSMAHLSSLQNDDSRAISSHMAGRWCLRRPLDLVAVERSLDPMATIDPMRCMESYIEYALANRSKFTLVDLCLPLFLVVEQLRDDYDEEDRVDGQLLSWDDMENLHDAIRDGLNELGRDDIAIYDSVNFKRLASSFKKLAGTKVVNKWKRNRSEL
jgi:tRNA-dihydrouridine synthase